MRKNFKKLAGVLAVLMLLSVGMTAFAQEGEEPLDNPTISQAGDEEGAESDEDDSELVIEPGNGEEIDEDEDPDAEETPEVTDPEGEKDEEDVDVPEEDDSDKPKEDISTEEPSEEPSEEPKVDEEPQTESKEDSVIAPMVIGDNTPPVLKSVSGSASTKLPGSFKLDFDFTDDFSVASIYARLDSTDTNGYTHSIYGYWSADNIFGLFSGKHSIELKVDNSYGGDAEREYTVAYVALTDWAGNVSYWNDYDGNGKLVNQADEKLTATTSAKVKITGHAQYSTVLKSFKLKQSKLTLPGDTLEAEIELATNSDGISNIGLSLYKIEDGQVVYASSYASWSDAEEPLKTGKHTIEFELDEYRFETGEYVISYISLGTINGVGGATYYRNWDVDSNRYYNAGNIDDSIVINNNGVVITSNPPAPDDATAPVIKSAKLKKTVVSSPGILELELDIVEAGSGVSYISMNFAYEMSNGMPAIKDSGVIHFEDLLKTGKHTIQVPLDNMYVSGLEYSIEYLVIADRAGNYTYYTPYNDGYSGWSYNMGVGAVDQSFKNDLLKFTIEDVGKKDIFSALDHPDLLDHIKNMADDGVAYVNFDNAGNTIAPAALFEAIMNTNKTIVFQSESVQWRFAGEYIQPEKVKDIDLYVVVYNSVMEEQFGDEDVVVAYFENEGDLPGPASIHFANQTLLNRYGDGRTFYLTHFDHDDTQRETIEVKLGGDGVFSVTLSHNSYFVLSSARPLTEGVPYPVAETGGSSSGSSSGKRSSAIAETGDTSAPYAYVVIALLAACGAGVAVWKKKRTA